MITIRRAEVKDVEAMQDANLHNLPENYSIKYYLYHLLSWPGASFVALNEKDEVIGYVLGKMADDDDEDKTPHGHVTSLSVRRNMRRNGIAGELMKLSLISLYEEYKCEYVSLHVRASNRAALHLYRDSLKFQVLSVEKSYYQDGEDAYYMKKELKDVKRVNQDNDDITIDLI